MAFVASRALASALLLLGCTLLCCTASPITIDGEGAVIIPEDELTPPMPEEEVIAKKKKDGVGITIDRVIADGSCPSGWTGPYRQTCYRLSDGMMSWHQANATGCAALHEGAHLASVTYSNKAFLSKQGTILNTSYYWVGLREGDDEWNKGTDVAEKVDFTRWEKVSHSEPDGLPTSNNDCVFMTGGNAFAGSLEAGRWLDWSCDFQTDFICQKAAAENRCPPSWRKGDGNCYKLIRDGQTFARAEKICKEKGATLVTEPDYAALLEVLPGRSLADVGFFWIGLRSAPHADGALHWLSAEGPAVTQTNWAVIEYQEPVFKDKTDFNCVFINGRNTDELFETNTWGVYDCSIQEIFLCALKV